MKARFLTLFSLILLAVLLYKNIPTKQAHLALASYGPHSSLDAVIKGIEKGLQEHQITLPLEISDVAFDSHLIPQMLKKMALKKPEVLITLTTPVSQAAHHLLPDMPVIFSAVSDPIEAGLLNHPNHANPHMTGVIEAVNLDALLGFIKTLLPHLNTLGLLYASGEANDHALLKNLTQKAQKAGLKLVAISVDQARDVPARMQGFKNQVQAIYVGTSGPIQPTLPAIVKEANKMEIPIINADKQAVYDHLVLASFGVDYEKMGLQTAKLVAQFLNGTPIHQLPPIFPKLEDHQIYINLKQLKAFQLSLPKTLSNAILVH